MTVEEIVRSKTKMGLAIAILSALVGLVDYTVRYTVSVTVAYADVKSDIRNLNTLMMEKQQANDQDHEVFRIDIRELRARFDALR
jgi:hypothetical protein